ncbi:unnamed protein product [Bemisia tabaci]|uniref:PPM-type phosphatase domain-containing protein n=2 Tax=Bemisia tabaci TaxID=7038 RepID=A0A9P0FAG5_BEMTA|nr:unnamed protein product [Bemisia tabaci]
MTAQIDQEPERWSGFKSGSTALVALIVGSRLFVANVGDSRGVMCDFEGRTVPLSFDHKPNLASERARIIANGGDVSYVHGAWRVNGHLALSRALGDGPDEKRLGVLIADPDILTFELGRHRPRFLVLATDGLWDVLSNEDVVAFLTPRRLREEYFGAKSLAYYAYLRGSEDNITVVVVDLRSKQWASSVKCGNGDCGPSSRSPTSSGRGSTRGGGKKSTPRNSIKK